MGEITKIYVGLDVHKGSIAVGMAEARRIPGVFQALFGLRSHKLCFMDSRPS